jgi:hypothetical protein
MAKIKAISECKWKVKIVKRSNWFFWLAFTKDPVGLTYNTKFGGYQLESDRIFVSGIETEIEWEQFAKANGITTWKYV